MKTKLLNKLSKEGRERIILLESQLKEHDEQIQEINIMLNKLENNQGLL